MPLLKTTAGCKDEFVESYDTCLSTDDNPLAGEFLHPLVHRLSIRSEKYKYISEILFLLLKFQLRASNDSRNANACRLMQTVLLSPVSTTTNPNVKPIYPTPEDPFPLENRDFPFQKALFANVIVPLFMKSDGKTFLPFNENPLFDPQRFARQKIEDDILKRAFNTVFEAVLKKDRSVISIVWTAAINNALEHTPPSPQQLDEDDGGNNNNNDDGDDGGGDEDEDEDEDQDQDSGFFEAEEIAESEGSGDTLCSDDDKMSDGDDDDDTDLKGFITDDVEDILDFYLLPV
jgi:hypothetical protein